MIKIIKPKDWRENSYFQVNCLNSYYYGEKCCEFVFTGDELKERDAEYGHYKEYYIICPKCGHEIKVYRDLDNITKEEFDKIMKEE